MFNSSSTFTVCPEHSQLLALVEGRLTDGEADSVSCHVAECDSCDARLEQIEELSDPLVQALASLPATEDDEATFLELQANLLSQPEAFTGTGCLTSSGYFDTVDDATPLQLQGVLPFQLGNYELFEQIGAGAHGAVFRARHRRLEREVAVKLLLRARGPFVEEFLNEMRVVGKLDHPNIIRATDAGEHDGIYFLVMDFVPGLDVSSLLRRTGPLKVADACEIARQTALGLAFAHEHNLVHRDVKTSNLLFATNGRIKLLDLGLAMIPSGSPKTGHNLESEVGISEPRGTADYMAPEQWREASAVTHKADLYSLGCTLFKLLTGQPPFKVLPAGISTKQQAHESSAVPPLSDFRDDVPDSLERLMARLLSKSAEQRPESAGVVAEDLNRYTSGANFQRIARKYCPELELPAPAKESGLRRIRRLASRVSRRTWVAGAVSIMAAATMFFATRQRIEPSFVDTTNWRTLSPSTPAVVQLAESDSSPRLTATVRKQYELESKALTLVHLGNPMKKPFRWRTSLAHESDRPQMEPGAKMPKIQQFGVFFRLRKNEKQEFGFQTIELLNTAGATRLLWCEYQQPDRMDKPLVLAESACSAATSCELELVIGRTGFPQVAINGEGIPQSLWVLSKEANELVASNVDQLPKVYAGRIGVIHHGGLTTIQSSQLLYLNK